MPRRIARRPRLRGEEASALADISNRRATAARARKRTDLRQRAEHEACPFERDFAFPERISQHLHCAICTEVFNAPLRLPCGHYFCAACILQWMEHNATCPACRRNTTESELMADPFCNALVNELSVFCPGKRKGCQWTGELGSALSHWKTCAENAANLPAWLHRDIAADRGASVRHSAYVDNDDDDDDDDAIVVPSQPSDQHDHPAASRRQRRRILVDSDQEDDVVVLSSNPGGTSSQLQPASPQMEDSDDDEEPVESLRMRLFRQADHRGLLESFMTTSPAPNRPGARAPRLAAHNEASPSPTPALRRGVRNAQARRQAQGHLRSLNAIATPESFPSSRSRDGAVFD